MAMSRGSLSRRSSLLTTHSLTSSSIRSCKSKIQEEEGFSSQKKLLFATSSHHHQAQSKFLFSSWIREIYGKLTPFAAFDSSKSGNTCQFVRSMATAQTRFDRKKRDLARREFQLLRRKTKLMRASMSPEEKILWRLKKANRKRAVLLQRLKKYELEDDPEPVHDPELITPEQLQALKKIGYKNRNYAPIGRRGVYGGVVQNMHMHWKFHETVQVDCHIFKREDMRTIAKQLAVLSGGIVIDIHQKTNIIMYRGRNYKQPKTEMIPKNTLTKRKALFKSKFLQALDMIDENIKNLDGELLTLRRKQKECIPHGGEVSTPLNSEMLSRAEYDEISSDDGEFSWETDSLDEDELSEDENRDYKKAEEKIPEVENKVKSISWTAVPALHDHKRRPRVAKELVTAETQLFMHRENKLRERESIKCDEANDQEEESDNDDDGLGLSDEVETETDNSSQLNNCSREAVDKAGETKIMKNGILQDDTKRDTSCDIQPERVSSRWGPGQIRNRKIAQFLCKFNKDNKDDDGNKDNKDDDEFGTDFDDSDDLDSDSKGSEPQKFESHKDGGKE